LIESVAWDTNNKDPSNTGEILIGSRDGRIFETAVEAKDKLFVEGKEKYFKPIYALGEDQVPAPPPPPPPPPITPMAGP
jgi:hypothetical protein